MKVPLDGSVEEYGEYFVRVGVGSPPQYFDFQVDTGSTDLLVYGSGCDGCPTDADPFNPNASSTAKPVPCSSMKYMCDQKTCYDGAWCPFDDAYGDGSDVTGFVLEDTITLGGVGAASVSIGVIEHSSARFEPTGVDGIFGLATPATSAWASESPLIEWLQQNGLYKAFGMCLQSNGGSFSLGLNAHSNPDIIWTPTVKNQGEIIYYPVSLTDLKLNGKSLGINSTLLNGQYGALVDSGTTLMLFPSAVYSKIKASIQATCSSYKLPGVCGVAAGKSIFDGYCYSMSAQDRARFPSLTLNVAGSSADLTVTNEQYLIAQNSTTSADVVWCFGIEGSPPGENLTILGDTFMRAFFVVFDQERDRKSVV